MTFTRNLYWSDDKRLLPHLERIERLYELSKKLPQRAVLRFAPDDTFEKALDSGDFQSATLQIINDVYHRIEFFWYTSAFKAIKLCEALVNSYNTQNLLAWCLIARSTIEYSAVISYFFNKLLGLNPLTTSLRVTQIQETESLLIMYSHGTRFNWDVLDTGKIEEILKNYQPTKESPWAINVLTALSHLAKSHERFRESEAMYAMLSDFAHPNMASHSLVCDMPEDETALRECRLSVSPNQKRGYFVMLASLPAVDLNVCNIFHILKELETIAAHWGQMAGREVGIEIEGHE
jgi:hypothetical protein